MIPSITLFRTVKAAEIDVVVKLSPPSLESRVAAAISTSAGEFTRVGTLAVLKVGGPDVRFASESFEFGENTW